MKLTAITDLFIQKEFMEAGLESLKKYGVEIDTIRWEVDDPGRLQEINLLVERNGSEVIEPPYEVFESCKYAEIIVTHFCIVTQKLIDACPHLKIICVLRGGVENINLDYATQKNILCVNTPGRTANAVADFTVALALAETRNIARSHANLKNGKWIRDYCNADRVPGMVGRVFGIIGLGEIGLKVVRRLKGFEVKLLGYDPFVNQDEVAKEGVTVVDLDELLQKSDVVSINARLTDDTYHMVGARELNLMKPTAYLINTARSGLVDEQALYEVLKNRRIMGAALDVFDVEPAPPGYPLLTLDNVTVTPHLAGGTIDTMTESPKILATNLSVLFEGGIPHGALNWNKIDCNGLVNPQIQISAAN